MTTRRAFVLALTAVLAAVPEHALAQLVVTANDNKVVNVNGRVQVVPNPPPDTVMIFDLKASPPKAVGEVQAPVSVVGPPTSVAVTPDESLALVTASMKVDPSDPTKQAPDNRMSVIDLKASPPRVLATLESGRGASGVSINRAGTLALVANRHEGTVAVFTIQGPTVTPAGKVTVGDEKSLMGHVAIAPDGRSALVTRAGDHKIAVLSIDGTKVEYTKYDMVAGFRPAALAIASTGAYAVVGNLGGGGGDEDTVSLIDLRQKPPRVVDHLTVGPAPEGVAISPDGSTIAVVVHNGTTKARESPFYRPSGKLVLLRVSGQSLARVAEAPIGHWSQGAAFSADGRTILVGNMIQKDYWVFEWTGTALKDTGVRIAVKGGAAAVRTAEK
jgi:DNA-binding beta-propeller fold protein YncE